MIRALLALGAAGTVLSSGLAQAQLDVCGDHSNCDTGFYCDRDSFQCRPCLSCESLKRNPPRAFSRCITSVTDCGDCIKGLVEDRGGDVFSECVPPDARAVEDAVPAYVWVAVVLGLCLLAVLVFVIVYLLRNTYTFKILASTRTSVESPRGLTGGSVGAANVAASAPELPPPYEAPGPAPYNPQYAPPPRDSACPPREDESSWPFIKRVPSQRGTNAGAREAGGRQAARVFNNPRYVRAPHLPSSYKIPSASDESESTFTVHDEDTMESTWTPAPHEDHADHADHAHHADTNGNAVTSGSLVPFSLSAPAAPHAAHASHAPHASHEPHALCAQQDTNNNRNVNGPGAGQAPAAAPSFIINVVQKINAVQQHNDVTL